MLNVVVLVSGGGTNLQAIIDAVDSGEITNTKIAGVISNNKNAYILSGLFIIKQFILVILHHIQCFRKCMHPFVIIANLKA